MGSINFNIDKIFCNKGILLLLSFNLNCSTHLKICK